MSCGSISKNGAKFCSKCGAVLNILEVQSEKEMGDIDKKETSADEEEFLDSKGETAGVTENGSDKIDR